jgi:Zn-dependent M32 family carboxypeptidase
MQHYIVTNLLHKDISYVNQKQVGDFLREKVFAPAAVYRWDDMIERAFGESLTTRYFAADFVK